MKPLWVLLLLGACSAEAPKPVAKAKVEDPNPYPVYRVAVAQDGLVLTDPKTGEAKPAAFGLRQSLLLAILARTLGPATEGREPACKRDFARWNNGLTLWFEAGDFTGWSVEGEDVKIGVAPGMTRKPVMKAGIGCG